MVAVRPSPSHTERADLVARHDGDGRPVRARGEAARSGHPLARGALVPQHLRPARGTGAGRRRRLLRHWRLQTGRARREAALWRRGRRRRAGRARPRRGACRRRRAVAHMHPGYSHMHPGHSHMHTGHSHMHLGCKHVHPGCSHRYPGCNPVCLQASSHCSRATGAAMHRPRSMRCLAGRAWMTTTCTIA